ncbi:MAG TPA: winged helix-turn-helix domain-containing protein [Thermoanaerobaculia bacterium]
MSRLGHAPAILRFGEFEADLDAGLLRHRGERLTLRGQAFEVLAILLEHAGDVVTREQLRRRLWPDDVFVDFDNNLNTAVARLREALNDSADQPRYIETVPRRGYRFLSDAAPVTAIPHESPVRPPRLLVLPFMNASGDSGEDYLADAMPDELITELASFGSGRIAVIARTTAMLYKGTRKDIASIGRELALDYAVEGGIRRSGDCIAITLQVVRTRDQIHVFARRYETSMNDIITLQETVARDIAEQIDPALLAIERAPSHRIPTANPAAYNKYLRGRHRLFEWTPDALFAAKKHFEEAVALDPGFALAHDGLAEAYSWIGFFGLMRPQDAYYAGTIAATRALELDDTLAETHALLGTYRKELDYNWVEVDREMKRGLELNPNSPLVRERWGLSGIMPHGRIAEAIVEIKRALELDPLSIVLHFWLAELYNLGRDNVRAMEEAQLIVDLDPTSWFGPFHVGQIRAEEGAWDEAISALRRAAELSDDLPFVLGWLGMALARSGDRAGAHDMLEKLRAAMAQIFVPPSCLAWIYLGLDDIDSALAWMDRAIDERDPIIIPILTFSFLDPLRSDPRFKALVRKMNLEQDVPAE